MKNLVLALVIIFPLCLMGCSSGVSSGALVGRPAPSYTPFFMVGEDALVLEHLRGKNVIVLFWASTCAKSHTVIEELNSYVKAHRKDRNLEAIAVSIDKNENFERVERKIGIGKVGELRHSFSGNDDYDQAKVAFEVDILPSLFVINEAGTVIASGTDMDTVREALGS